MRIFRWSLINNTSHLGLPLITINSKTSKNSQFHCLHHLVLLCKKNLYKFWTKFGRDAMLSIQYSTANTKHHAWTRRYSYIAQQERKYICKKQVYKMEEWWKDRHTTPMKVNLNLNCTWTSVAADLVLNSDSCVAERIKRTEREESRILQRHKNPTYTNAAEQILE